MKFSENWLREWVDPGVDRAQLLRRLTMAGLEVESVETLGDGLAGIVVGEIVAAEQHPNADRLRVCAVNIGTNTNLQIVCGAPNARAGLKAPLAAIGAKLPNGITIKAAALRGVDSQGMLCSGKELGIDEESDGLLELPQDAQVGQSLADFFQLPDAAIEIKLTPNRPDCLGMRGLAYDVGALFACAVREPAIPAVPAETPAVREIILQAGADCPRYLGRVISTVDAGARSPLWLTERLRRAGLRPISAIVDVMSYVMLELGQPMHAFDQDKLEGPIVVRRARAGESTTLLDGSRAELDPEFLVIADRSRVLALAGIMGGMDSRVTDTTKNVFLESAHFAPYAIMGKARRLGMHTDASHRFERGVDPELPRLAIERATALFLQICGGKPGPVSEAVRAEDLPKRACVHLRHDRLTRVLGMSVPRETVEQILRHLGMNVVAVADGWQVTAPSRRFDIQIEEDLIEEVVRVYGYDRVPIQTPSGSLRLGLAPEARLPESRARAALADRGYHEAINYSFVANDKLEQWKLAEGAIALANPLSADLAVMRTSLLPGLVSALQYNRHRQQDRVRLFELGKTFHSSPDGPIESQRLAAVACGPAATRSWAEIRRNVDFYDLKADLQSVLALARGESSLEYLPTATHFLHPGRSATVCRDGKPIGLIGNLDPRLARSLGIDDEVYLFEVDFVLVAAGQLPRASELPKYPSVRRDLSFELARDTPYSAVEACVRAAVGTQLVDCLIFDQYAGPNLGVALKSLAIGLILQDSSRTLTDQDADRCVADAIAALERVCGAKLRG